LAYVILIACLGLTVSDAGMPLREIRMGCPPDTSALFGAELEVSDRVAGWRVEPLQLGRGQSSARLAQYVSTVITVAHVEASTHLVLRVTALRCGLSLIIPDRCVEPPRTAGIRLKVGGFLQLRRRDRADLYLPANSSLYLMTLRSIEKRPWSASTGSRSRMAVVRRAPAAALREVVRYLSLIVERCGEADALAAATSTSIRSSPLVDAIHTLFECSEPCEPGKGAAKRRTAVDRVRTLIDAHPERALRLEDLCRIAGARPRTVEYGFRELLDTTPMRYIRGVRLDRVRRQLLRAGRGDCSISMIARRWGFVHMGQFDAHYRMLYGETPSMTRARSAAESE
jgi:AraC-like DNA-binding protein